MISAVNDTEKYTKVFFVNGPGGTGHIPLQQSIDQSSFTWANCPWYSIAAIQSQELYTLS